MGVPAPVSAAPKRGFSAASKAHHGDHAVERVWLWRVVAALLAILAIRLVSLYFNNTELFFDEAQYWAWAQEPAFGYFSKPPFLAWLIGLSTELCGADTEYCVRISAPAVHTVTAFLVYAIARDLFDDRTAFWSALAFATLPALSLSATIISTDVPLLMFWAAALFFVLKLERYDSIGWALALGVALGLGLLSKYAMAYFLMCAAVYSLSVSSRPHLLAKPRFWLAIATALLVFSPNIWWNRANQFITVGHTADNIGWTSDLINPLKFLEFLGSQFGVMGPVLFGAYLFLAFTLMRRGMNRKQKFLLSFSLPVLALICVQAFLSKAFANWAAVTYVAATILVVDYLLNRAPAAWLRASFAIHFAVFAVIATAVAFSRPGQLPLPKGMEPFARVQGGRQIARAVRNELEGREVAAIVTDTRRLTATLSYYLRDRKEPILAWRLRRVPQDHFELTRPYQTAKAEPVLFITTNANPVRVLGAFGNVERLREYKPRAGDISTVWMYRLEDYKPGRKN
jgi:4-amino-4-deoxy-L-arabinose transferase-like glycosyltransferase